MIFRLSVPDDSSTELELNEEGIDWLIRGLERLRACEVGCVLTSPSLSDEGVGEFALKRAADEPGG